MNLGPGSLPVTNRPSTATTVSQKNDCKNVSFFVDMSLIRQASPTCFRHHGYAPDYITNLVTLTSATSGRSHLRSADSLTLRHRTRMGDHALSVASHVPGMHFQLTFVMHPVGTLLRSVSNHICFLIHNNFFKFSDCLLLCILSCTVSICTVLATSPCKHFL